MERLATFSRCLDCQRVSPMYFILLSEAGFAFCNVSGKIVCDECGASHNLMNVRNDPRNVEYHHGECPFISPSCENVGDFSTLESRMRSFDALSSPFPLEPYSLALLNYYYEGVYHFVRCCKCNISFCVPENVGDLAQTLEEGRPIICECSQNLQLMSSEPSESRSIATYSHNTMEIPTVKAQG